MRRHLRMSDSQEVPEENIYVPDNRMVVDPNGLHFGIFACFYLDFGGFIEVLEGPGKA